MDAIIHILLCSPGLDTGLSPSLVRDSDVFARV